MVSSSKILTVSYGTFSCTLEGFDDSFDTMKAIAEYFRDLAADDRYFGAEPPTPDADMLARIAEREIERRVEARVEQGGVVLRPTIPAPVAAAPVPEQQDPAPQPEPVEDAPLADADPAPVDVAVDPIEDIETSDKSETEPLSDLDEDAYDSTVSSVMQRLGSADPQEDVQETTDLDAEDQDWGHRPAAAVPVTDSVGIAEKLQRIRNAVAQSPEIEDTAAQDAAPVQEPVVDEAPEPVKPAPVQQTESPASRPRIRARVTKVKRADFDAAVASGQLEEIAPAQDDDADILASLDEAVPGDSSLSPEDEADLARELAEVSLEDALPDTAFDEVSSDLSAEAPGAPMAADPMVQDDLVNPAAAPAADLDDDFDDWDEEDEEEARKWAEAEARIKAEAAALEDKAEMEATVDRLARESVRKTVKMSSPARAMLTETAVEEDHGSVSRILDETNTHLDEPEGNRRRSAIAHLRAAVAATRADRILGGKRKEDTTEAYREDLANVVRPRRPQSGAGRSERPDEVKPAPLKLVAEQRVDAQPDAVSPAVAQAIRPRRVSAAKEAPQDAQAGDDSGFTEFAARIGATELPDLLEAAAAYMSFVEGRDEFSRPQLMSKVRQAESRESSREDRLRSFGLLLREGKIEKTQGGRFIASQSNSFKPDARAVG